MKKLTIAFLYNQRKIAPDPEKRQAQLEADADDPQTIQWMVRHLRNLGHRIIPIEADEQAYFQLYTNRDKIDLVFNYAGGSHGHDREAQMPAMLEMLRLPYTGLRPLTQSIVLNKIKTKEILKLHGVAVLPHQVFRSTTEQLHSSLRFPLIVKPTSEGSGAGISNTSVVKNRKQLSTAVSSILQVFKQPAMVEPFASGREYSVGLLGNNNPQVLPIISPRHDLLPKTYKPIDSFEVKWVLEDEFGDTYFECPARIPRSRQKKIESIALSVWKILELRDFCRIDMRTGDDGTIYVLEVNSPAGLIPPEVSMTSYFPLQARAAGIAYEELISIIISHALKRYGIIS